MEYLKKIQEILSSTFIFSNGDSLDEDFRQLLQILYFFGFHRPVQSTQRTIYGVSALVLIAVSFFLGCLNDSYVSLTEGHIHKSLVSAAGSMLIMSISTHFITFLAKENPIMEIIKAFQVMHAGEDPAPLVKYRKMFCQVIKFYKVYVGIITPTVTCIYLCGFRLFKLIAPALYDSYAEGDLYYPLLIVNIVHVYLTSKVIIVSDLLPVLFIVRSGANFEILSEKLRRCTASDETSENEKELIACIKYHRRILEETKRFQEIFSYFFMSKVCGTIVVLTSFLLVIMKNNVDQQLGALLFGFLGLGVSLFQIGSLCLIGQWLTTKSRDLLDASYDCAWYNQSNSFKKTLMILRLVCQRDVKVGAIRFDFSNGSFYQMLSNTYSYYNNMSQSMESIGSKH